MGMEIIAILVSLLAGGLLPLSKKIAEEYLKNKIKSGNKSNVDVAIAKFFGLTIDDPIPYKQRISETLGVLRNAFIEVDKATSEFASLMKEKEINIDRLEKRLIDLSEEETTLKDKVELLQKVPLEAISHFEQILNKGNKRSAFRDYLLFGLGVIVSITVTLILKFYFEE